MSFSPTFSFIIDFNPRTHVGCDANGRLKFPNLSISIHAPTWGATLCRVDFVPIYRFQSTHPRGVRHLCRVDFVPIYRFQSTHPRGVRRITPTICPPNNDFNPRTHVGCDSIRVGNYPRMNYFNPRTHVGCDCPRKATGQQSIISIHAPTWGATRHTERLCTSNSFQSTHPRGVRLGIFQIKRRRVVISIHAPTWGATQDTIGLNFNPKRYFNPRTHVGCDSPVP